MKLTFIPQRRDDVLTISKNGDVINISGDVLDFTDLADGEILPASEIDNPFIIGSIKRENGNLTISLLLPRSSPLGVFDENGMERPKIEMQIDVDGEIEIPVDEWKPENANKPSE